MSAPVLLDAATGVARITLDRPERGNAINQAMADALVGSALPLANDPAARCVPLTEAGKSFCVGGDIAVFENSDVGTGAFLERRKPDFRRSSDA